MSQFLIHFCSFIFCSRDRFHLRGSRSAPAGRFRGRETWRLSDYLRVLGE